MAIGDGLLHMDSVVHFIYMAWPLLVQAHGHCVGSQGLRPEV